jgi:hypothetical protein
MKHSRQSFLEIVLHNFFSIVMLFLIAYQMSSNLERQRSFDTSLCYNSNRSLSHPQYDSIMIGRVANISYRIHREHSASFKSEKSQRNTQSIELKSSILTSQSKTLSFDFLCCRFHCTRCMPGRYILLIS